VLAIVAPGQGSQTPGFLKAWLEDKRLRELLELWSDAIGLNLVHLGTEPDFSQ
jgi:[acyl-carrier-protein] S-malonyltransferase